VRRMSSTFASWSSVREEVSAPASNASTSSTKKQVLLQFGSSPPWHPRTWSFTLEVSELPLHREVIQIVVQPRGAMDGHSSRRHLHEPRALQLGQHEADRGLPDPDLSWDVFHVEFDLNAFLHRAAPSLTRLQNVVNNPARRVR